MGLSEPRRVEWADACKFMSIALVVWLHFGAPSLVDGYVHLFHMPVFYLLSGVFLSLDRGFGEFVARRARGLLVPYLALGPALYLLWQAFYLAAFPDRVTAPLEFLGHLLWDCTTPIPYGWGTVQWFLPSLFLSEVMLYALAKAAAGRLWAGLLPGLVGVAFLIVNRYVHVSIPLAVDTAFAGMVFVGVGYAFSDMIRGLEGLGTRAIAAVMAALLTVTLAAYVLGGTVNVRTMEYGSVALFVVAGVAGSLMLALASMLATRLLRGRRRFEDVLYVGRNTIVVLYLHRSFDGIDKTALELLGVTFPSGAARCSYFLVATVVFLALSPPLARFANGHFPRLLGR